MPLESLRPILPGSLPFVGRVTSAVVVRYDMDSAVRVRYLMLGRSDDENQRGMLLHLWVVRDEASAKKESCERGAYSRGPTDWHNLFMAMYEAKQSVRCIHSARLYVRG